MTWVHSSSTDKITFWPPLHLQRQAWALGVLREEGATSVLDIGCGEGSLIQALCSPSPTIDEPPVVQSGARTVDPTASDRHAYLHVKRLAGLDSDPNALAQITLPPTSTTDDPETHTQGERWTQLAVDLWEGDLGQFNEELNDYQAMVALEVIEHLPEDTLQRFGAIILGEYRPSLLLVTSPNYDFNQRFDREGEEQKGWKDPTGRTDRVFRHDDHKFEWTPAEFTTWCQSLADEYGYTAHPTLLGAPTSPSPTPPTPTSTHATNACLFRLSPVPSRRTSRSPRSFRTSSLPFLHAPGDKDVKPETHHRLVTRLTYKARSDAGKPRGSGEIREAMREVMQNWGVGEVGWDSVWREMRKIAGGSKRALIQALGGWGNVLPPSSSTADPSLDPTEWELSQADEDAELVIRWTHFVPPAEPTVYALPLPSALSANTGGGPQGAEDDGGWGV